MKKKRKIISLVLMLLCISLFSNVTSNAKVQKQQELNSSKVTLITKVLPQGEMGYAIVCDFGLIVDNSTLSNESFQIETIVNGKSEGRTITKVYTNDVLETSDISKPGRYVIIELDTNDANAATLTFNETLGQTIRNDVKYSVTLNKQVKTLNGVYFDASNEKILNGKVVTPIADDFKKLTYKDSNGENLNYRLFNPKVKSKEKKPLVIFLHGSGERGSDNATQILSSKGAVAFADPELQKTNPCYVLAPQAPFTDSLASYWCEEPMNTVLFDLIKDTIKKYNIDKNRIYITGLSNGGDGVWNLIEKHPKFFAAAVPICGIPNSNYDPTKLPGYTPFDPSTVKALKTVPTWVFQAADDPAVDVRNAREIVAAIREAGGNLINYTEYPEGTIKPVGHLSWVKAYEDKDLMTWLFNQSKKNR